MNPIDPLKEQALKNEVNETYDKVVLLRADADWTLQKIFKLTQDYPDSKIETMDLAERKSVFKEMVTLLNRIRINAEELLKADKKQEELRKKANEFYGEELLPPSKPLKLPSFNMDILPPMDDAGEEWKR